MEETKVRAAKKKQEDTVSNVEETSVDVSRNTLVKRERGRMQSSKKSKVRVTDINPTALGPAKSNGESAQPHRGRGRPRLSDTKQTEQRGVRPKTTAVVQTAEKVLNGGSDAPKRGRPKGTIKCKPESLASGEEEVGSPVTPRKRGRPKKSPDKEPRIENTASSEGGGETDGSQNSVTRERGRPRKHTREASSGVSDTPPSRRGRPRKYIKEKELVTDGAQPERRGRGRPKGSLNKSRVLDKVGRLLKVPGLPAKGRKRGRPRQQPAKRGRPRKYPPPSPEEVKKPKVWKPLGRPRKYPCVETSAEALPAPRRSRGRPCKSESKKGAHLRKNARSALPAPHADGVQRKRGRPASAAKGEGDVPRKRGRPKGSVNKNRARGGMQLDSLHSKADGELAPVEVESEVGFDTEIILI